VIPQHLHQFFWDIDPTRFDPNEFPQYTIARLLELGDQAAIEWLRGSFSQELIRQVICAERRLSRRSANYWALVYGIPREQVAALQQPKASPI
jgi:hypothetical protein